MVRMLDDADIRRLPAWGTGTVAATIYLDVDRRRHPRWPDVERRAAHLFHSARERARGAGMGTEAAVEADLAEIGAWLGRGLDRSGTRGFALFSCAGRGLRSARGSCGSDRTGPSASSTSRGPGTTTSSSAAPGRGGPTASVADRRREPGSSDAVRALRRRLVDLFPSLQDVAVVGA